MIKVIHQSKHRYRRHSKKKVDQDSSSSAETVTTKHNKQKTIHVNGVIHGPQWAVILSSAQNLLLLWKAILGMV